MDASTSDPSASIADMLRHREWVRGVARTLVWGGQDADDLEQQAWLEALESPPRGGRASRGWFATIIRRTAGRLVRTDSRRRVRETRPREVAKTRTPAELVAEAELHERVVRNVLALEEPYRETVLLRFYEGLPPREIASRVHAPVATVNSRLRRGLATLRSRLDSSDRDRWRQIVLPLGAVPALQTATSIAVGALLMNKVVILLAVATILGIVIWFATDDHARRDLGPAAAPRPVPPSEADAHPAPELVTPTPAPAEEPPAEVAPTGHRFMVLRDGAHLPGATVLVIRDDQPTARLVSDQQGRAVLDGVAAGRATAWAWAEGCAPLRRERIDLALAETRLELGRGSEVRVRFITPLGEAVPAAEAKRRFAGVETRAELASEELLSGEGDARTLFVTLFVDRGHWCLPTALEWDAAGARLTHLAPKGRWRLFLTRPGMTPHVSRSFGGEGPLEAEVVLGASAIERRVRFVDAETRAPLGGAPVVPYAEFGDDRAFFPGLPLTTDSAGEVLLPLHDGKPGFERAPTWWIETATHLTGVDEHLFRQKDLTEIRVPRRAAVYGKAWLQSGLPAVGRPVVTARKGKSARSIVDREGNYRIDGVPDVAGKSFQLMLIESEDPFVVNGVNYQPEPGKDVLVNIGLPAGVAGTLSGRVTMGGQGLQGVHVVIQGREGSSAQLLVTDASGKFSRGGIQPGAVELRVFLGDPRAIDDFTLRSRSPITLDPGEARTVDLDLPAGAIEVTLVDDETGRPIPRAVGFAKPRSDQTGADRFPGFEWEPGWGGFATEAGTIVLIALLEGAPHTVGGGSEGYSEGKLPDVIMPGTLARPAKVTLRLKKRN